MLMGEQLGSAAAIGQAVRDIRRDKGITASVLADRLGEGWTGNGVAKLENGYRAVVTIDQFIALCRALSVSPRELDARFGIIDDTSTALTNARLALESIRVASSRALAPEVYPS